MGAPWIWIVASATLQAAPTPSRPSEKFTVHIELAPDADFVRGDAPGEVQRDVARAIKGRKRWIFLSEGPEKAELVVRILAHRAQREHETVLRTRVRDRARRETPDDIQAIDFVDVNRVFERHLIRAEVRGLGHRREIVGFDERYEGSSRERAASRLARELEDFLKQNYRELEERRRRLAASGLELESSTADSMLPGPAPVEARPAPFCEAYFGAVEVYGRGRFEDAVEAIASLTRAELYAASNYFLARDRSAVELKAAALLHTQSVARPASGSSSPVELARRTALELGIARRYTDAIPEAADRESFQKRWHLATAYHFQAEFRSTEAEALLSSGLQRHPGDRDLLYALAAFHEASSTLSGKSEGLAEAEVIYRLLLAGEDPPTELLIRMANVSSRLGRPEEAEAWIARAERSADSAERPLAFLMVKGRIAAERGEWRQARALFREAWNADPDCQACVIGYAAAEERLGNRDRAARIVLEWLEPDRRPGLDGWWKFLLGPAADREAYLRELQSEVFP